MPIAGHDYWLRRLIVPVSNNKLLQAVRPQFA